MDAKDTRATAIFAFIKIASCHDLCHPLTDRLFTATLRSKFRDWATGELNLRHRHQTPIQGIQCRLDDGEILIFLDECRAQQDILSPAGGME